MNMRYRKQRVSWLILGALAAVITGPGQVLANGVIVCPRPHPHPRPLPHPAPRPLPPWRPFHDWTPFTIQSQRVDVVINDLSAETTLEQVFVNRSPRQAEGTYLFPVPQDAAVHDFSMWMNGREVSAELLDAEKARQIYESIVSRMKDPALLQFAGCGLIQAKVFPIPAGGECRIKLEYGQLLSSDSGLTGYRFMLGTSAGGNRPIERFSLRASIRTTQPLSGVFSPSHECSIDRRGEHEAVIGLEKSPLSQDNDFQVFYQTGGRPFGLSLLTHRPFGEDGFFMARISPKTGGTHDAAMPKNICLVLDTSGSMAEDNKIAQAKRALKFCITNLGREDRFSLITFSTEVREFRSQWSRTDPDTLNAARAFIDDLKAVGGTDINAAMLRALELNPSASIINPRRPVGEETWRNNPYFVVFVTDGEPTVGVTDPGQILKNISGANHPWHRRPACDLANRARVFVLGVGYKVNTKLLDRMADDNGGARQYVTPAEDLELKISAFYTKLANPVLAGLKLVFDGVQVSDLYPRRLPDLFRGSELVVVGRYRAGGAGGQKVTLTGTIRGEAKSYTYDCRFASGAAGNDFLPRVWAVRKIGYLLDELRLHGQTKELKDEVVRLSTKYGILTPYTSFLVQEDEKFALRHGGRPAAAAPARLALRGAFGRNAADMEEAATGQTGTKGARSVKASRRNVALQKAKGAGGAGFMEFADYTMDADGRQVMNSIGGKTFYLDNGRWVDAEYDGKAETTKLTTWSKAYFDFVAANQAAGSFFAQGDQVLLCWQGRVYETVPAKSEAGGSPP